jgi:hypothetical protein
MLVRTFEEAIVADGRLLVFSGGRLRFSAFVSDHFPLYWIAVADAEGLSRRRNVPTIGPSF